VVALSPTRARVGRFQGITATAKLTGHCWLA
jgi:hypothetical protein